MTLQTISLFSCLQMYPQGEIPILNDKGHILGESAAILQYLGDRYGDEDFYPRDPVARSIVNHRLAFYASSFQRRLYDYYVRAILINSTIILILCH